MEPFGTVSEVKLITDRETGQPRGFGFVTMSNVSEGNAAIKGLDGKDKGGRKLKVNEARIASLTQLHHLGHKRQFGYSRDKRPG